MQSFHLQRAFEDGWVRSLLEGNTDCAKIVDLDGRLVFMNQRGCALMSIADRAALEGRRWTELWPSRCHRSIRASLAKARAGEESRFTAECPTGTGAMKTWDVAVSPIRSDAGEIVAVLAVSRDVTAAVRARRRGRSKDLGLARKDAALRAAHRSARLGGWEVDFVTGQLVFSAELWRLLGVRRPRATSLREGLELWAPGYAERFEQALQTARTTGGQLNFEGAVALPGDGVAWFRVIGEPVFRRGACVAMRGSAQDITAERRIRDRLIRANARLKRTSSAALAASQAKSQFLAVMSHEIRTPLNGVLGMAQAMERDELSQLQRQRLEVIRASGEGLSSLLNDILDLSKIEAGKIELEDGVIDIDETAASVAAAFASLAAEKDLSLHLEIAPAAKGCWRGDSARLRQILQNLVSNAVKFTERGAVNVEIGHAGRELVVRVVDTGPGIRAAGRQRLFEKFVQADASTTRRHGGTGLGLAISRDLARLMGGDIEVDSIVGAGSIFTLRLPLERAAPASRPASDAQEAPIAADPGLRILAAEDNQMNRLVLKTLLGQLGIDPCMVENGEQAIQAWETGRWDLILMDVQMPVMDGLMATRIIRDREARQGRAPTPILALTANAMSHHAHEYLAAGMNGVIAKPIHVPDMLRTFDEVLGPGPAETAEPVGRVA